MKGTLVVQDSRAPWTFSAAGARSKALTGRAAGWGVSSRVVSGWVCEEDSVPSQQHAGRTVSRVQQEQGPLSSIGQVDETLQSGRGDPARIKKTAIKRITMVDLPLPVLPPLEVIMPPYARSNGEPRSARDQGLLAQ